MSSVLNYWKRKARDTSLDPAYRKLCQSEAEAIEAAHKLDRAEEVMSLGVTE